jgi:heat shock protein HslJ
MKNLFFYTFVLAIISSCGSKAPQNNLDIEDKKWTISEVNGEKLPNEIILKPIIEFSSKDGSLSGSASCNRINGKFIKGKGTLQLTGIVSTKMSCEHINWEQKIISILENTIQYEYSQGKLVLISKDGKKLMYTN